MIEDRKQRKGHHASCRYGTMVFLAIVFCGAFAACGKPLPPDRQLVTNTKALMDNETPGVIIASSAKILPIQVLDGQSSLTSYPNGTMDLTIETSPFAICNFIVTYGLDAPSKSFGIVPVTADSQGIARWHWQVEGKAPTGTWPLQVTASLVNGAHTTQTVNTTVTFPPINLISEQSTLNVSLTDRATLTIATAPFLPSTLTMDYMGRTKTFKGTADGKGVVSWHWLVLDDAPSGSFPLTVTITTGSGEHTSKTFTLQVD